MTTHAITRPTRAAHDQRAALLAAAAGAPPPDPTAWLAFLCHRCGRFFRVQGIHRHCTRCIHAAAAAGVIGSEHIGEASGA